MPARVADNARAAKTRDKNFIARIVNPSATALQTGESLGDVNQLGESGFVGCE
jgi:hypothetical protein